MISVFGTSILASLKFRKRGTSAMEAAAREIIFDCGMDEGGPSIAHSPGLRAESSGLYVQCVASHF